ncbi:hypothetical protein Tco_0679533 [Tanacetum coccineum]|uniref:Reverse transcriptase domain-containing protein n=1 Tax=Tanacetum coccineum TaxID=301880 RepID=A0ABQ4XI46_9ASTR
MNTASSSGMRSLPSNTVANPKGELKAITTQSGLVLDEPSVPIPHPFINLEEDEREEEILTDQDNFEFTIKVPPPSVQQAKPPKQRNSVIHQMDPRHPNIPYPSRMNQEKQKEKDERSTCPPHYGRNLSLRTARALIDVHGEEMILRDVNDDIFDPEEDIIKNLLNLNKTKDLPPYHDNHSSGNPTPISELETNLLLLALHHLSPSKESDTTSSSPSLHISENSDYFLEEFADELAHITFPPGNDDLPFDAESDLLELEYLLNHDPIKDMDSILEDSVDENSFDDNLDDTISEMFTDEHALDYSSPPLWDDYDDNLFDHETVIDDTYDDPFDFKEEKIKDSKILIDELDSPESSDFLPFPESDSVFYEDFSKVDALPSTNNEDKVFNLGILIHENLFEVTNFATPDKNVKKTTNASLILEDFNPPLSLYEHPFHKEVPGLGALLSLSSKK